MIIRRRHLGQILSLQQDLANGLVGWFPLSINAAQDESGNAFNGTISSPLVTGSTSPPGIGIPPYGRSFNGSSDFVNIVGSTTSVLSLPLDKTISVWLNPGTLDGNFREALCKGNNSGNNNTREYLIDISNSNQYRGAIYNSNTEQVVGGVSATAATANQWTMVTLTKIGTSAALYINGVSKATSTVNGGNDNTNQDNLYFGRLGGTASGFWHGSIAEVRIYNRGLTPGEVFALYASTFLPWAENEMETLRPPTVAAVSDSPSSMNIVRFQLNEWLW